ncbi:MAG TPA: PKD domain-containing protein [Mycobacteriales bacterium]|nr:PKD domain-containing protein [Mycobacteriales bacterium]
MRFPRIAAVAAVAVVGVTPLAAHAAAGHPAGGPRHAGAAIFQVGTAVEDITPTTPQYLGGFGQMDAPTAAVHDPLQVRAFAIAQGTKLVEFAIVDTQGWFSGYQEGPYGSYDARTTAASYLAAHGYPGTTEADLIVSSTHSHAAPTLMGIWGPVDVNYLKTVHDQTVKALEEAAGSTRPATLWTTSADSSAIDGSNVSQTDIYDGYAVDGDTPVLWARDPQTLQTVGLYVNVPVHADVACGSCDNAMSADHIGVARDELGARLGATAVVAMGTLGREESIVQVGRWSYSHDVGMTVTDEVLRSLAAAKPITSDTLASAEQYILVPLTNPLLAGLSYANVVAPYSCVPNMACSIDRSITPPYVVGAAIGSWVTAFRIGDVVYMSEPGEAFPEVSKAIRDSIRGASVVNVVGMAQDQLGYYWPPEEAPATTVTNDSDHLQYNSSVLLGELSEKAARDDAAALGFSTTVVHQPPMQTDPLARTKPGVQFFAVAPDLNGLTLTVDSAVNPAQNGPALVIGTNPDGTKGSISYEWGDGSTSYGGNPGGDGRGRDSHTYAAPGTYTVTGTVTDANGSTRSWQQDVTISD